MIKNLLLLVFLVTIGAFAFIILKTAHITPQLPWGNEAQKAGNRLSNGLCKGKGTGVLSVSPMKPSDFAILIPYGAVIGDHVTPIDHQYFAPADYNSPRDAYEVVAMAESTITDIQPRTNERGTEYRMVFTMTCTFFYYYDLVTSLSPDIKAVYDQHQNNRGSINIAVSAGQAIGRIGGQTLDFAVWNTEEPLPGFVNPKSYEGEYWKIFTDNPYLYYTPELKKLLTEKNIRTAPPIEGKIDYDIDGKIVGNWFVEGTNGYEGSRNKDVRNYSKTHLAIIYDHIDPQGIIFSTGDFNGQPKQFGVAGNSPNPADVGVEGGLVKYELTNFDYIKPDGGFWDRKSLVKGLRFSQGQEVFGCALAELIEKRKLKVEIFPGSTCTSISAFTMAAKIYER